MATLNATAGDTAANSYATRDQASAIFDGRPGASAWASANDTKRAAALMEATAELEQRFTWRGAKASENQALSFPRSGIARDGVAVAVDSIPAELIRAVSLYADFLLGGGESPGGVLDLGSVKGMRTQHQDALPGPVIAALPSEWVRSHVGSTVAAVAWD